MIFLFWEYVSRFVELNAAIDDSLASIKAVEGRIAELNLIAKYAATYRKCRPVYNRYRKSDDKEKNAYRLNTARYKM